MKKFLFPILFFLFTLLLSQTTMAITKDQATEAIKELTRSEFTILEMREAPIEGFWEVVVELRQEKMLVYIHQGLRFVIHGQIIDRQLKKNLTSERLKEFRTVDVSALPLANAIPMGEGKRRLYVFTDPQCFFCYQLHEEIKMTPNLKAFFFLFPLNPVSHEKAKAIWCSRNKLKALEEAYQGKELKSLTCDTGPIEKNMEIGKRLMIDSTPTLIFENGKVVQGHAQPNTLEDLLSANARASR